MVEFFHHIGDSLRYLTIESRSAEQSISYFMDDDLLRAFIVTSPKESVLCPGLTHMTFNSDEELVLSEQVLLEFISARVRRNDEDGEFVKPLERLAVYTRRTGFASKFSPENLRLEEAEVVNVRLYTTDNPSPPWTSVVAEHSGPNNRDINIFD
ncbi:hypothetical protein D9758_012016 [Tetrapyrgos nigripes]|uniref:Uncharacterized protein n=1 Tax=Tetrapyrgos nigripes TaxID=182062 RepID=A0A8H5FQ63_9AGAR|nr:hypothetical protein D9758_012016 [Tetrapyrgos nigripes]